MREAKVFSETYERYLSEIAKTDYLGRADLLGLTVVDGHLIIPLFDITYRFDGWEFHHPFGEKLTPAVKVMLSKYLLTGKDFGGDRERQTPNWMTYREFKGSSPLHSYFTNNTNKTLESAFRGNVAGLRERSLALGGEELMSASYDLSIRFWAFPRIPMILNFNDADEMFPPAASVLYQSTAELFLDLECLAMTGTLLTGKLLKSNNCGV